MQSFLVNITLVAGLITLCFPSLYAQEKDQKLRFNGLGRANLVNSNYGGKIEERDTTNAKRFTDGEFLLDLAINATPNNKTEVQTILRLRNEFGGFFGAGMSVEVRELWAKGIIGNAVRYNVGDIDLVQTPYTLFNPDEEGTVNEAEVFKAQKEIVHYENFYKDGNTRRMQGAKIDFGLQFTQLIDEMEVEGFITRIRGTDFFTTPNTFVGGGTLNFVEKNIGRIGLHYVNTFDDLSVGAVNTGIQNAVYTLDGEINLLNNAALGLTLNGEAGWSSLEKEESSVTTLDIDDSFAEIDASLQIKSANLTVHVGYRDVGPDFYSVAAQSKRVDFSREKRYFNRIGNERAIRTPSLFDLSRDPQLYTFQLFLDGLANYDPRLSNTLPYGKATPNRRGITAGIQYSDTAEMVNINLDASFLSEIRGQGTQELKDFSLIQAAADVNLHKLVSWKKQWVLTLGLQLEKTQRGGEPVEQVDLNSTLIEAGLQAELFDGFDLLLGAKTLSSEGSDYVPLYEAYNIVLDFPGRYIADDTETLLAGGVRYRFKEGIYLTAQLQNFDFSRATNPEKDYSLSQFFILYTMNF